MKPAAVHHIDMNMATSCSSLTNYHIGGQSHHALIRPYGPSSFQNVQILQNFRQSIQSEYSQASQAYPDPAKNKGDKRGGDGEEVHHGVQLEHEHQLVIGGNEPHEKVSHEENIQDEIKLKK